MSSALMPTGLIQTAMTDETEDDRMKRLITAQFKKQYPKRFYKEVGVSDAHAVLLDGRPVKTPVKNPLVLPSRKLAEAVASEWRAQEKEINPELMPLTKMANTALDRATAEREHVVSEIVGYAGSDLVCYWAEAPEDLVQRQRKHWQPVLDWVNSACSANFKAVGGISHVAQDPSAIAAVRAEIEKLDQWHLTALYLATALTGSALLSLMFTSGALGGEAAWQAAHVDEDYQIEKWGDDWEAAERRAARRREFDGLSQYLALL